MKIKLLVVMAMILTGCLNDTDKAETSKTQVSIEFEHFVGDKELKINTDLETYDYETALKQNFSVTKFGYYITNIKLITTDDVEWEDQVQSSIHADEVKGFYQVLESENESKIISLKNVSQGQYAKLQFTVGIPEATVAQGAQGGILDLAEGAWFWNWDSGYIGMKIEGFSKESTQEEDADHLAGGFTYHIGGWRDIEPMEGMMPMVVDNIKTIEIELPQIVLVDPANNPVIHVVVDLAKILDGAAIDFSTNNHVHMPAGGAVFANQFDNAFMVHHVH